MHVPGDVIHMMDNTSVEVLNTDAEGRLVMADALCYAKKYNPELVIDFATLTGAAVRAIGKYGIVAMGNADIQLKMNYVKVEILLMKDGNDAFLASIRIIKIGHSRYEKFGAN